MTRPTGTGSTPELRWQSIDTVVLDMDGTILDLHYDNTVWNQLIPAAYAAQHDLEPDQAGADLLAHMLTIRGTIEFYSFEYWHQFTGLDLIAVHRQALSLVRYRSGALAFLNWLSSLPKRTIIATNAHRDSLLVKYERIDLTEQVDLVVSSHDYGFPKEDPRFWEALAAQHNVDFATSLFVDDNESVLDGAAKAGVGHLLCVNTPDSQRPLRTGLRYPAFDHFNEIYTNPSKR